MGAEMFCETSDKTDPAEAFAELVADAQYEHGHGGYTGTIAEKDGYVIFEPPASVLPEILVEALQDFPVPRWVPEDIAKAYDSKWGPAVAIRMTDGTWTFMGWASS